MFESAEIGHAIDKATYDAAVPDLREALLQAQYRLKAQARFPEWPLLWKLEAYVYRDWLDDRRTAREKLRRYVEEMAPGDTAAAAELAALRAEPQ